MVRYIYVFSWQLSVRALKLLERVQVPKTKGLGTLLYLMGWHQVPKVKSMWVILGFSFSSPSLHPRHIQTLSESCQFNLLNISGICTLLSIFAANSLGQALFIFPVLLQQQSLYGSFCHSSSLIHASDWAIWKSEYLFSIEVLCGIQGFSLVGLIAHAFSCFLVLFLCHLAWVTPDTLRKFYCDFSLQAFFYTSKLGDPLYHSFFILIARGCVYSPERQTERKHPHAGTWSCLQSFFPPFLLSIRIFGIHSHVHGMFSNCLG